MYLVDPRIISDPHDLAVLTPDVISMYYVYVIYPTCKTDKQKHNDSTKY